jgi:hypothetical protein
MYSWLCPWLLTWSDFGDDYEEDDEGYDDAVRIRIVSRSVTCRVEGLTWASYAIRIPLPFAK